VTEPVSEEMRAVIAARLDEIEREEGARILLAIESGSRAWGFHSPDSDYDVRFVYVRPVDWHLGLRPKRDVIERPIDDELDLAGWDLGKALGLAIKSNAVIAEWLQSPIVYRSDPDAVAALEGFTRQALTRRPVTWHYRQLLTRQMDRGSEGGKVRIKRFFYALRPALALRWMRVNDAAMAPMDMAGLMAGADLSDEQVGAIEALIARKKQLVERAETEAPDPILFDLIRNEQDRADSWLAGPEAQSTRDGLWEGAEDLNRHFIMAAS